MKRLPYLFLFCILIVAAYLRFHTLTTIPPSLNWDEVATGYNAYSILQTGKDEFGKTLPLYFRSYDDFKQPVYMYITVGSIAAFGYNDFAVRFPSAFFGTLTVLLFYFLVHALTKKQYLSLLTASILAILPWHIQFSRYAVEATVGLFFVMVGSLALALTIQKKRMWLPVAVFAYGVATYTYQSYRIILPFLTVLFIFLYPKQLLKRDRYFYSAVGMVILFSLALVYEVTTIGVNNRFSQTSVLHDYAAFKHTNDQMLYDGTQNINLPRRFFHEIPVFTSASLVIRGYMTHFSPDFLFFDQNQKLHFTPDMGYLYLWMIPFIPLGMFFLIREKQLEIFLLFFGWLVIAPIPASVTWDIPQGIRTLSMVIPFSFFAGYGIYETLRVIKKKRALGALGFSLSLVILILVSLVYFVHQYTVHFPHERSQQWQYGEKGMSEYLEKNKKKYKKIILAKEIDRAYMFMLYYSKYDPRKYLAHGGTVSGSTVEQKNHYDTFYFSDFDFTKDVKPGTLFVGIPTNFPPAIIPLHTITYLDKTPAILFVTGEQLKSFRDTCLQVPKPECTQFTMVQSDNTK